MITESKTALTVAPLNLCPCPVSPRLTWERFSQSVLTAAALMQIANPDIAACLPAWRSRPLLTGSPQSPDTSFSPMKKHLQRNSKNMVYSKENLTLYYRGFPFAFTILPLGLKLPPSFRLNTWTKVGMLPQCFVQNQINQPVLFR